VELLDAVLLVGHLRAELVRRELDDVGADERELVVRRFSQARLYSAGMSRRLVRSPDAPKITSTHGSPLGSRAYGLSVLGALAWVPV